MIKLHNIHVGYNEKEVLQGITHHFAEGLTHGILGLNGSGKTTLFNTVYGLLACKQGHVELPAGISVRKHLSFLESELFFYHKISGHEYLTLFEQHGSMNTTVAAQLLHLPLDEYVENYSHGMKKKIAFLAVMLQQKPIWLLDEPFNGLDLQSVEVLKQIIKHQSNGARTILLSSHIIETLYDTCDVIHYLHQGNIVHSYTKENFASIEKNILDKLRTDTEEQLNNLLHPRS